MKAKLFCIYILMLLVYNTLSCDKYDFSFENKNATTAKWLKVEKNGIVGGDTIDFIEGKSSLCFIRPYSFLPFYTVAFQTIVLPNPAKNIEITIQSKNQNKLECFLKAICLDLDENIICTDSISLSANAQWGKSTLKLATTGTQRLYIEISAASNFISGKIPDKDSLQKFNIDNLFILIDNKDLKSFKTTAFKPCMQKTESLNVSPLNKMINTDDFKNHSIIAFGESVHGSMEMQKLTLDAIIDQIKYNNCKLVLMEFPFETGLRINKIIQGKSNELIEDLLLFNNLDFPSFNYFIQWLTNYNKSAEKKVMIVGLDENKTALQIDNLKLFLLELFKDEFIVNEMMRHIYQKNLSAALKDLELNCAVNHIEPNTQIVLIHAFKTRINQFKAVSDLIEGNRDYLFFRNAEFAINNFIVGNEKTAIFTHLGHVNKTNNTTNRFMTRNFGNYMFEKYKNQYFVIGILVGEGNITSFDKNGFDQNFELNEPPHESIEYLLMKLDETEFYINGTNLPPCLKTRIIGALYYENQFYSFAPKERIDGTIFIKRSSENRLPENWPKTMKEIKQYLGSKLTN